MNSCYQETLNYLYSFANYETQPEGRAAANFDLRRMEALLMRLGNPHRISQTIHIAGTKGKGSTAAMVAATLTAAGFVTGLYTSPHLIDVRERVRVGDGLISTVDLTRLTNILKPEVAAVNAEASFGTLTTFELLTALGFMYFAEKHADWQVVEVGLGGRLDATNVVSPEVCAISVIGFDHADVLGDTLEKIATEKAGIIKQGVPVVSAAQPPEARDVIAGICRDRHCQFIEVGRVITYQETDVLSERQRCVVHGRLGHYELDLPLLGAFQQANAALAVGVLEVLMEQGCRLSPQNITDGLGGVRWPGRFQVLNHQPLVVVDGAHNLDAAVALKRAVETYVAGKRTKVLVLGVSADKDYRGLIEVLAPLFDIVIATRAVHPRAFDEIALAEVCKDFSRDVRSMPSIARAMELAVGLAGAGGFVCATGSLFVVGEALTWADRPGH